MGCAHRISLPDKDDEEGEKLREGEETEEEGKDRERDGAK